jgi:hypothetical protein
MLLCCRCPTALHGTGDGGCWLLMLPRLPMVKELLTNHIVASAIKPIMVCTCSGKTKEAASACHCQGKP